MFNKDQLKEYINSTSFRYKKLRKTKAKQQI